MDIILSKLGDFGPYQLNQYLLHVMTGFVAGVHILALSFTAATPEHRCFIPEEAHNQINVSQYIPQEDDGKLSSCSKFSNGPGSKLEPCGDHYFYDPTYYRSSRVTEWNLVCDKAWLRSLLQSIFMFGVLFGAVFCGALTDRFGRKPILSLCAALQFIFGLACAFAPNYAFYASTQFLYGAFGSGGNYLLGFILSMEVVGPSKRTAAAGSFGAAFSLGLMEVPFWAWLVPNGRFVQIVCAAHGLLFYGHLWLMDESIPWLRSKGRIHEAAGIAIKGVRLNGKYLSPELVEPDPPRQNHLITVMGAASEAPPRNVKRKGVCSLFLYPNLRCRMLIMCFAWFANSLAYYGLSFNIGALPGNPFLMGVLIGVAEMPGYVIVLMWLDRTGRRSMEFGLCLISGLACILVAFIPQPAVVITLAMLAKVAIAGSFTIVYNYAAELFPTSVRASVLGITTMAARFAGMLSPVIILLAEVTNYQNFPTLVFGTVAVLSSFLTLFLPETTGKDMPQEIEDGEEFGRGDTAFREVWRKCFSKKEAVTAESKDQEATSMTAMDSQLSQ